MWMRSAAFMVLHTNGLQTTVHRLHTSTVLVNAYARIDYLRTKLKKHERNFFFYLAAVLLNVMCVFSAPKNKFREESTAVSLCPYERKERGRQPPPANERTNRQTTVTETRHTAGLHRSASSPSASSSHVAFAWILRVPTCTPAVLMLDRAPLVSWRDPSRRV